ncbi:expressed unknown protein [Seminavis robusta]|uniref:Uncharacterized protein n=1 Tax=Seminavis robusta TaxID=568900 RepID=A0A9N8H8C1_9STRA|nr:expressed unknown protein [Seminavis robusta]|eukprot:Sro213_g315811.1  (220) ;mRNA; r:413-1072
MTKPGLCDSKGGGVSEQGGIDTHSIQVRFNINEKEEDLRTERGIEARRERKENKKMAEQNREGRIRTTLSIIRSGARSANLLRLCRAERRVGVQLNLFLDEFLGQDNRDMRPRLAAFRALPENRSTSLTRQMENSLIALQGEPSFSSTFSAYLPSAVLTSEDSDEQNSPQAKRLRRRRRRRDRQQKRQDEENRRIAAPEFKFLRFFLQVPTKNVTPMDR